MDEQTMRTHRAVAAMGLECFSTQSVCSAKRVAYWNDLSCNTFTGVDVDPGSNGAFSAGLRRLGIDDVCVADVWSAASTVRHTAGHISKLKETPHFLLHLQLSGASLNTHGGRETILRRGDATICDTARPWTLAFDTHAKFLVCRLPTSGMQRRLRNVEDLAGTRLAGSSGAMGILSSFLQTLLVQAESGHDDGWLDEIGPIVLDLVAMGCRSSVLESGQSEVLRSRHQKVLRYIKEYLTDPCLSVHSVAQQFGLGARSIQKLFASHGTTLGSYVLKERLKFAASRLGERDAPSVTEIALSAGFNDLTHFGRVFRRSFGVSPREYRSIRCRSHPDRTPGSLA